MERKRKTWGQERERQRQRERERGRGEAEREREREREAEVEAERERQRERERVGERVVGLLFLDVRSAEILTVAWQAGCFFGSSYKWDPMMRPRGGALRPGEQRQETSPLLMETWITRIC